LRLATIVQIALALSVILTSAEAADFSLRVIGQTVFPTGTMFQGVEFGGISGIDRASDGGFFAISDDRGGERGLPRFYKLGLAYDSTGFHSVTINQQIWMQQPDGSKFPAASRTVDPESIRVAPNGNLYWCSEGIWDSDPANRYQPFVREMKANGEFVREFTTPAQFNYADNRTTGGRNNKLFEALAVTPGGIIFVANEGALIQDGNITSLGSGSTIRVTAIDPSSGNATAQFAYRLPPIPMDGALSNSGLPDNGLSELLAVSDTQFIAVERSYAPGIGNVIRLVLTEITPSTTDIGSIPSLVGASYKPMSRELLLDMSIEYKGIELDNIEAITWGSTLANGNRTLILVSDNNFSASQVTQFIALEVVPSSEH
jgi:hypothetical protein